MQSPSASAHQILSLALFAAAAASVPFFVDLTPAVERDLFFSSDDPQLEEAEDIRAMFPAPPQIIVSARSGSGFDETYVSRIGELSRELQEIEGVRSVLDILHGPEDLEQAFENPLWQRVLVSEDGESTNLVVLVDTEEYDELVPALEEVWDAHRAQGFELAVSGEPYVVERVRELVVRDFQIFGVGALVVFTLAVALLYRSLWIVLGALSAGGTAAALTLLGRPLLGLEVDLLTPNIVTVVFVLTLLHIVFLTNNRERAAARNGDNDVATAIRWTRPASFWAMVTTGIGFASLLFAPAEPARNFGISCAMGAALAFLSAYVIFPAFLRSVEPGRPDWSRLHEMLPAVPTRRHGAVALGFAALALLALPGLFRLNTDPDIFEYFSEGSDIREGLERIDRAGGSVPLELVIRDAGGAELNTEEAFERMWRLQRSLEDDPDVGSVLSLPVLMAEAEEQTFWSFILSWEFLLERMEAPEHEGIAAQFVTEDRRFGRFLLRMKESARGDRTHAEVIDGLESQVREHGFEPAMVGGLYSLQAAITELVTSSLVRGLVGILLLFVLVAFVVARGVAVGAAMVAAFSMIPLVLVAAFGYLRLPLDVIALPAANIALAIGVDDLIHLVHHRRREAEEGKGGAEAEGEEAQRRAWVEARRELLRPLLTSSLIVVLGFGLLLLSSFPPTRRLGFAVVLGSVAAVAVVLFAFPSLALFFGRARRAGSE